MPPCGAAVFAFRQFIGRAVDIGERQLCGTPVISRYRPTAVVRDRRLLMKANINAHLRPVRTALQGRTGLHHSGCVLIGPRSFQWPFTVLH